MIYDQDIERQVISGMIQFPNDYYEVSNLVDETDFYSEDSKLHLTLYKILKSDLDAKNPINAPLLISKIRDLNITFTDNVDLSQYILSLDLCKLTPETFLESIKALKRFSIRRKIFNSCKKIASMVKKGGDLKYEDIIEKSDKEFNGLLSQIEGATSSNTENLFDGMEEFLYDKVNNPQKENGLMGPFDRLNQIYGSILRPGNIAVIVARSSVGKTTLSLDYSIKVAEKEGVPVIHFDNGEMSKDELLARAAACISGIPIWLIESGGWVNTSWNGIPADDVRHMVLQAIKRAKKIKFYYHNIAGMSVAEQISMLKRIYFSKVGRNNKCLFCYDYIKLDFTNIKVDSWVSVAKTVNDYKQAIHKQILDDLGNPCISMLTSVQANRAGITKNKSTSEIIEDESVVSLADGITQFCSHLFLLRNKTLDELADHGKQFGTHVLKCLKARHLGKDIYGHLNEISMPDGTRRHNHINLDFSNFSVSEKGDLRDIVKFLEQTEHLHDSSDNESLPQNL